MDTKTDAKVRKSKSRSARVTRVIEKYDFATNEWFRVEITEDDELNEMDADVREAYMDIITTASGLSDLKQSGD
jgi:hypothetical protein